MGAHCLSQRSRRTHIQAMTDVLIAQDKELTEWRAVGLHSFACVAKQPAGAQHAPVLSWNLTN